MWGGVVDLPLFSSTSVLRFDSKTGLGLGILISSFLSKTQGIGHVSASFAISFQKLLVVKLVSHFSSSLPMVVYCCIVYIKKLGLE